uniref:Ig-like domain-containing protein n=1 Tax=Terrapene triunguis TaxID=2587831 RepID=A0A674I930_9SAUR
TLPLSIRALFKMLSLQLKRRTFGDSVTQTEGTVLVKEGAPLVIECTYETILFPYLLWYIQYPNEAPKLWLRDKTSGGGQDEGEKQGFFADHVQDKKSFDLKKSSSEVNDSAVYYCAFRDTVIATSRGAEQESTERG